MKHALINARIFTGDEWLTDHALVMEAGRILDLCPTTKIPSDAAVFDAKGRCLLPGLIDIQVNGGGGVLFNDAPTVETLRIMGAAHRRFGTTGFLPTLISDDLEVMTRGIEAVTQAMAEGVPGVLGIHLEGPFLNPQRKGVHDADKFRRLDRKALELLSSLKTGKTLVTLAPELTTPEMIRSLVSAGVLVSAGHTAADYQETRLALNAGLSCFTHLFNAMTPMSSREPGVVGAALEDCNSWCGLIVDGYHVHPSTLKVAIAAKALGKMLLVTDAMPTVGAEHKEFVLKGETIRAVNGRCATADDTLAGSDLDMLSAVRNCVKDLDLPLDEAVRMASRYPAELLGMARELGTLAPGYRANVICIDDDLRLNQSWIDGKVLTV
ncbi:N-acetylglucosamine-6-phosphate deacetylase [Marinimicrobium sp. ABcell2]|uniref:N-acetylglucosamine-6-phosphate deacetylase n=1 Tax=Marinimicrobium sp. ABcell2 TaxID=3069751 RepID=UPI0027B6A405|nr:N-acetylglucosamine-6-phosphate deacetylase [Marinimicrobium sp. ABcell2]MDQ2075921.1 N-acetylglucosamine-6-phosphate deacetylase [Marinimicrobium sp. ABcell2]